MYMFQVVDDFFWH